MLRKTGPLIGLFILVLNVTSCGSDTKSAATTATTSSTTSSTTFPSGLSMASSFARRSSSSFYEYENENEENEIQLQQEIDDYFYGLKAAFDTSTTYTTQVTTINTVLAAASSTACQITLPTITSASDSTTCYGPGLDVSNHVNAASTDSNDGASASNDINTTDDGRLPTGDLGIWSATDTASSMACSAAKVNSLIAGASDKVMAGLLISASMNCVVTVNSLTLPSAGSSLDVTTQLSAALTVNNSGTTLTSATITRLTDVSGNPVYQYYFNYSNTSGQDLKMYLKHMNSATDGSTYTGKMWGSVEGASGGAGDSYAFSLLYQKSSSTSLSYRMRAGSYNKSTSNPHPSTYFSNGDFVMSASMAGNYTQLLASIDPTTSYGNISYSWQAGGSDSNSRVFNAYASASGGCGFFGFGGSFTPASNTYPANTISTFICNWAGPGNSHTGLTGRAQKQCMTVDTNGRFQDVASKQSITYAPVNSCDFNGTTTNGSSRNFNWANATSNTDFSVFGAGMTLGSAHSAVTNNLVTLSSDTDYASYSAPSAPTDPF